MLVSAVTWTLLALAAYLAVGAAFAVPFVTRWAGRIDPDAAQGSWGFRVLIFPGTVALWPLLVARMRGGAKALPVERSPHRDAAPPPVPPKLGGRAK